MDANSRDINEILSQIESILFLAGDSVKLDLIQQSLGLDDEIISSVLIALNQKYLRKDSGLQLKVTSDSLQLVTKPENYEIIQKTLSTEHKRPLSKAAYEVLAIIAYMEPITRAELEAVRGVNSSSALQHLLDLGLVEECGRKEVVGYPYLFRTTQDFLHTVDIKSLSELPSYDSFRKKLEQKNE